MLSTQCARIPHFETLAKLSDDAGLATTANYARSVIDYIHNNETYQIDHMDETVRSARRFLYEEMRSWLYFEIPQHQVQYWMNTTPFGPAVAAKFPDAEYDIVEASKCLAVDRTTACVFHLMRALDFALAFLSAHLGSTVRSGSANLNSGTSGNSGFRAGPEVVWQ